MPPSLLFDPLFRGAAHAVAAGALLLALPLIARAALVETEIVDRTDNRSLPVYARDGRQWIVGTPGHEYTLRMRNTTGARVLVVASVDGVNIVTGETASPAQSGYVLDPYASAEIRGWRKSLSRIAAFYFTELPDAYAARTGRPDNIGVIGFAVFRERPRLSDLRPWSPPAPRLHKESAAGAEPYASAPAADAPAPERAERDMAEMARGDERSRGAPAAQLAPSLGTGHGRNEYSRVEHVAFERESSVPAEVVTFHYDRRDNLVAMGVLPPAHVSRAPQPFPGWPRGFVPDPPAR